MTGEALGNSQQAILNPRTEWVFLANALYLQFMLSNLRIVMVRPRGSGNIGSVARAMKNAGAGELGIVGKARTRSFWARAMAVHGREILADAKFYETLREAVSDTSLVVGTTCRSGLYRSHSRTPRDAATEIVAAARKGKVALIFGPEDHGLSNKDLEHCQLLITIPTHPDYQSLNVAQAAMICLYEFYIASLAPADGDGIQRAGAAPPIGRLSRDDASQGTASRREAGDLQRQFGRVERRDRRGQDRGHDPVAGYH